MHIKLDRHDVWYETAKDKIAAIHEFRAKKDKEFEERWAANYDKLPWICRWGRKRVPSKDKVRFYTQGGEGHFYPCMTYERQLQFCEDFIKMMDSNVKNLSDIYLTETEARMLG